MSGKVSAVGVRLGGRGDMMGRKWSQEDREMLWLCAWWAFCVLSAFVIGAWWGAVKW